MTRLASITLAAALGLAPTLSATAQQPTAPAAQEAANLSRPDKGTAESILAIDREYAEKLKALDIDRLNRLRALAETLPPAEAAAVYEQLFRSAVAADLFVEAEPAADAALMANLPSASCRVLASLVKLIGESDRGDFEGSLRDLQGLLASQRDAVDGPVLQTPELLGVAESYYQRLVHAGRYDVAEKAFRLVLEKAEAPEIREYLSARLGRLKLVGQPAPAIVGKDLDGRPFDLSAYRGKVVLVVFWATWSLPSAAEVAWLQEAYDAAHAQGFEIVGVNLDPMQDDTASPQTFLPAVRRFALDYNLRWPNLLNGPEAADFAAVYGVDHIPANALIDQDGKVVGLDLVRMNLLPTVSKLLGR
ncbi:TlpA disulfide reductase family protein [Paludisphaera sp.]|uniref:peroxiredoxin family protein n=1 Tax=Paludisphaera sp. TaxID=2017432 RepID=UPI00301C7C99